MPQESLELTGIDHQDSMAMSRNDEKAWGRQRRFLARGLSHALNSMKAQAGGIKVWEI